MITPETIERVREAADIVEIVGEHVKLRRAGGDFRGPCPFHGGKNPNFSVSPKRNAYHCFKCGVSGDAIGFVREHLGMDFAEAVRYVAGRAGVAVQETRAARGPDERDPREPLWEAMAGAAELFRTALWEDPEARAAREYLAGRTLGRDEGDRFALGYATRDGRWVERLRALGHDDARLIEVGLLVVREEGGEPRPRFRGRLMIPILDVSGRVVGFGGRVLGEGEPKYLNSPQTTLFDKGRLLYGLSWARHPIRRAERALVVEGYFDAMRLALAGVDEVVAPLGTALTESQAALLAKLTRNVFLLYDSDEAGLKATFRAGLELLRHGVSPRVVTLPPGEDPDSFVRAHGPERLEAVLAQGIDVLDRQILELERRGWFAALHKKRRAIDKLLPTLRATVDEVTREMYVARVAQVAGVDREVIQRELAQPERGRPGGPARAASDAAGDASRAPGGEAGGRDGARGEGAPRGGRVADARSGVEFVLPPRLSDAEQQRQMRMRFAEGRRSRFKREDDWASLRAVPRVVTPSARVLEAERDLVRAMLQERDLVDAVAERWPPDSFHDGTLRTLFERLVAEPEIGVEALADAAPADAVPLLDELLGSPEPDPRGLVDAWLTRLQVWAIDEEQARITARLGPDAPPLAPEESDALLKRKQALREERASLSTHYGRVGARPSS